MSLVAIVARRRHNGFEFLAHVGAALTWSAMEADADRFPTLHEATQVALRLPSKVRAFAWPAAH